MNTSSPSIIRWRLAQLAAHLVIALIALAVIGGATRVMEAGLACPDWPLCYGSLLPGRQMNVQVFLEWFHRLDAFFIGIALLIQFLVSILYRNKLPAWLPWTYGLLVLLVAFQAVLGGLTVLQLLPSFVVITHLVLALILVATMSGLSQQLVSDKGSYGPLWFRLMSFSSLLAVIFQSVLGSRMATLWSAQRCLADAQACKLLSLHRFSAMPVSIFILTFIVLSLTIGGWTRRQWPYLTVVFLLLISQISLGIFSIKSELSEPFFIVGHQLVAVLLVAFLSALSCRKLKVSSPHIKEDLNKTFMEPCHG